MSLPSGSNLTGRLGISGISNLSSNEIYNDKWDNNDDGAVGHGAGKDYEDEVDAELQDDEDFDVKMEEEDIFEEERLPKRMKTVTRLVERPKTVYERFPTFEKGKVLDFTELLKGVSIHKSRISKRPFHGMQKLTSVCDRLHETEPVCTSSGNGLSPKEGGSEGIPTQHRG